jgi:hypothetical protein
LLFFAAVQIHSSLEEWAEAEENPASPTAVTALGEQPEFSEFLLDRLESIIHRPENSLLVHSAGTLGFLRVPGGRNS